MSGDRIGFWKAIKKAFPFDRRELFLGLIWPAAAGNVAWALLQVALDRDKYEPVYRADLAILALVAIYLAVDWLRTKERKISQRSLYWIFDGLLVLSIVWFAIAIQAKKGDLFLTWSLGFVFGVAVLGHLSAAWENRGEKSWPRLTLAGGSILGLLTLIAVYHRWPAFRWNLALSFGTVLILWVVVRTIEERSGMAPPGPTTIQTN